MYWIDNFSTKYKPSFKRFFVIFPLLFYLSGFHLFFIFPPSLNITFSFVGLSMILIDLRNRSGAVSVFAVSWQSWSKVELIQRSRGKLLCLQPFEWQACMSNLKSSFLPQNNQFSNYQWTHSLSPTSTFSSLLSSRSPSSLFPNNFHPPPHEEV